MPAHPPEHLGAKPLAQRGDDIHRRVVEGKHGRFFAAHTVENWGGSDVHMPVAGLQLGYGLLPRGFKREYGGAIRRRGTSR